MSRITRYMAQHAVAFAALLIALGGSAYAAATVNSSDIQNNSVKSKDIRNDTVQSEDLGSIGETFEVKSETVTGDTEPNINHVVVAVCDEGQTAVGGGSSTTVSDLLLQRSYPDESGPARDGTQASGWGAVYLNAGNYIGPVKLTVWAVCAS